MSHFANLVCRNAARSKLARLAAPVGRLRAAIGGVAVAMLVGLWASADDRSLPLRWPQSAAGGQPQATPAAANRTTNASSLPPPGDRQAGANQPMRLPVLIPATGRRKPLSDPPHSAQLDPPARLEIAPHSPVPHRPAAETELRIRAVGEAVACAAAVREDSVQPAGLEALAAHCAARSRIVWPDMPVCAELRPGGSGRQPAVTELSFHERPLEVLPADCRQCPPPAGGPARLRIVAADEPAAAPALRLAWFAASENSSGKSLRAKNSASAAAQPALPIRQAAQLQAADGPSAPGISHSADSTRLGPFRIVDPGHEIMIWLRGTRRLLPDSEVVEAVPGDPNICQVLWDGAQEIVLTGRNVGTTSVSFHFRDRTRPPYVCLVHVVADPEQGPRVPGREVR